MAITERFLCSAEAYDIGTAMCVPHHSYPGSCILHFLTNTGTYQLEETSVRHFHLNQRT